MNIQVRIYLQKNYFNQQVFKVIKNKTRWMVEMEEIIEEKINTIFVCSLIALIVGFWFFIIPA